MVGVPSAHSWKQRRVQGPELEPASRGSRRLRKELETTNTAVRAPRLGGVGRGGAVVIEAGGLPDLQCCGVPPVQADRRALWLSF